MGILRVTSAGFRASPRARTRRQCTRHTSPRCAPSTSWARRRRARRSWDCYLLGHAGSPTRTRQETGQLKKLPNAQCLVEGQRHLVIDRLALLTADLDRVQLAVRGFLGDPNGEIVRPADVSGRSKLRIQKLNLFDHLVGAGEQ